MELVFDRRNSFSIHIPLKPNDLTMEDFRTNVSRRSFYVHRSVSQIEPAQDGSTIHLQGIETTTPVRATYHKDEEDQRSFQSPFFSCLNEPYDVI